MKIKTNIIIFVCILVFESMFKKILFAFFMRWRKVCKNKTEIRKIPISILLS